VHVSTHVSLREAINRVKKPRVLTVIRLAHRALKALDIAEPKIAVAGLNPHAGEHGLFGDEEIKEIIPAIEEAKAEGIRVDGPIAPDTVFGRARGGLYDIVVCMYHDQGHVPLKTLGFTFDRVSQKWTSVSGVNVTLGLPIIRTSVDHGTAFGKAGKGTAAHQSMLDAIDVAVKLAHGRERGLFA
jgi:4-hydroxythreonine-4-phosphate dehydrogenase